MNRKEILLAVVFLMVTGSGVYAQERDYAKSQGLNNLTQAGQIEIIQPEQAENLLKMQIANNHLQNGTPGYRIHVFSQSGQTARQNANNIRVQFMKNFPNMESYLDYNPPNYQVFVGNFRTKNEALKERKKIEKVFPGAFIVSTNIHIPK